MRRRIGPTQSPVVSSALKRRQNEARASSTFRWGMVCVLALLPLFLDLYFHMVSRFSGLSSGLVWYTEVCVVVVLAVSGLYDCVFVSTALLSPHDKLKVTPAQKKLLKILGEKEEGYEMVDIPTIFGTPLPPTSHSTPSQISHLTLLTPSRNFSSTHGTPHSSHHTPSSVVHSPHCTPPYRPSPFNGDLISTQRGLELYLQEEAGGGGRGGGGKDLQLLHGSPDSSWSGCQGHEHSSPLRKYHVATRRHSPGRHGDGNSPLVNEEEAVWSELCIGREEITRWTDNCRRWLAETVVVPVAMEIDTINKILSQSTSPAPEVGAASLETLRRECKLKGAQVPTLHLLLPYLDLSSKQGYLVQRIRELARGRCLGTYRWNGGGTWRGQAWSQDLPSDSQIVMHLLSTYMDSHLPLTTLSPNGRPFSSQHMLKYPDKPDSKKSELAIYQSCLHPPHYKVLIGGDCIEMPKGRNNLFHSIVVFLHYLKKERNSMLGSANLSLSGINILWIVE